MTQSQGSEQSRFISRGLAHFSMPAPAQPVTVSFVLMQRFTMLAFTSAIEPLRVANQLTGHLLFRWNVFSEDGNPIHCSNGVSIQADDAAPALAPSGYVLVCGGVEPQAGCGQSLADWIRAQYRHDRIVGGLCTGAYALARAGVLEGRRFTLHWENLESFTELYPQLSPERSVYCIDGRIVTCAGGVAAADLVLKIIDDHCGAVLSQKVMDMCLMTRRRDASDEQTTSISSRLGSRNRHLTRAVNYIETHFEDAWNIEDCAKHAGVSRRQVERLFRVHLGTTPLGYVNEMRLQRARALLAETDMSVIEVSAAAGFETASHFSRRFRKKFGISPHHFSHGRKSGAGPGGSEPELRGITRGANPERKRS